MNRLTSSVDDEKTNKQLRNLTAVLVALVGSKASRRSHKRAHIDAPEGSAGHGSGGDPCGVQRAFTCPRRWDYRGGGDDHDWSSRQQRPLTHTSQLTTPTQQLITLRQCYRNNGPEPALITAMLMSLPTFHQLLFLSFYFSRLRQRNFKSGNLNLEWL